MRLNSMMLIVLLLTLSSAAIAQEPEVEGEGRPNLGSPDQVDNQLESDASPKEPLVNFSFLDGVSGAAVALIALVTWTLAQAAVTDMTMAALAVSAAVLVGGFRLNSSWALAGAAAIGAWLL